MGWLLLIAGTANMIPPFMVKWWPQWKTPVDFGVKMGGKRILGDHKTWRGLATGIIGAEMVYLLIRGGAGPVWWGAWVGWGGLLGDMVKSFVKRRVGVTSGRSWFPWDQIDWVLGAVVVTWPWVGWRGTEILGLAGAGIGLHLAVKWIGYLIRVNETAI